MKKVTIFLLLFFAGLMVSGQVRIDQTTSQLASKYYSERDFGKAAPLYKELYTTSGITSYFRMYLYCLAELKQFEQAENEIKKEIRNTKNPPPELYIHYGYILKTQKKEKEADEQYREAIRKIPANKSAYINAANNFVQWREFELAEEVYLKGRKELPNEKFHSELSQVYIYLRNYSQLIEELLELLKEDEKNLPVVQSNLNSALYMDIENDVREEFKAVLLKRMQAEPGVTGFNRLLIWFFLQEKQFPAALRQSIALDRRTHQEDQQILSLAQMAINSRNYKDAVTAYDYILGKGKENPVWHSAFYYKIHAGYLDYLSHDHGNRTRAEELALQFEEGLEFMGFNGQSLSLIREYAHLLAFHLDNSGKAVELLEKGLGIPALKPVQTGELKTELADVYVYAGDPWEATLLYSQVIDANRNNALGDEAKLKKARLGYYLGNFSWARAQLDVLKASTSKLTANDAMELSLFISNNSDMDTTEVPLHYFARADYLFFRNQDGKAVSLLDSIAELFPYHSLVDDLLFRKARIAYRQGNYEEAAGLLERIPEEFPDDLLADDALFLLGEIWQFNLQEKERAAVAYRKILFDYPGSIYVSDARSRYRELNGEAPDPEKPGETDRQMLFF